MNKFFAFFLLLFSGPSFAAPAQILILRHAEKIESTNHLSAKGYLRAKALVGFFKENEVTNRFGAPVAIYAAYKTGASIRSIETMQPTAQHFKLSIKSNFNKNEFRELVQNIRAEHTYDGKTVVICWQHSNIKNILNELVTTGAFNWPDDVFDQVVVVDQLDGNARYKIIPQKVLPGDHDAGVMTGH